MTGLLRARPAGSAAMLAAFGDESLLDAALRFEAALARAEEAEGLISEAEAEVIADACTAEGIDCAALAEAAAHAGTLAIPLVALLRKRGAAKLHLGATSQDLADTALMLQAKQGVALITRDLKALADAAVRLAAAHADTKMLGRTLLQGALPITFGLKAANWALGIDAALARLEREAAGALALQFGGAAGTLAGLQGRALAVAERMAADLGLACPPMPWQARRDGVAGLAAALAIVTGAVGKIARDVALLAQGEVAETFEPRVAGRGGSSAMAHKRNPTLSIAARAAATRMPGYLAALAGAQMQEHERAAGAWQAEAAIWPALMLCASGALAAMAEALEGLMVNPQAMDHNLRTHLADTPPGAAAALIDRALAAHKKTTGNADI